MTIVKLITKCILHGIYKAKELLGAECRVLLPTQSQILLCYYVFLYVLSVKVKPVNLKASCSDFQLVGHWV